MRLQTLISLHGQQGGTIWQFNSQYGIDFLSLTDSQFDTWVALFKFRQSFIDTVINQGGS